MDNNQNSTPAPKTSIVSDGGSSSLLPPSNIDLLKEGGISTMSFRIDRDNVTTGSTTHPPLPQSTDDPALLTVSDNTPQQEEVSAEIVPTINQLNIIPVIDNTANINSLNSLQKKTVEQNVLPIIPPTPKEVKSNQIMPTVPVSQSPPVPSSSSTSTSSLPINLSSLANSDISLLALLQSNLPQLNQMRENLKTLIQSSLILQSLKSTAVTTPTQTTSQTTKLSANTMASIASAVGGSPQKTIPPVTPMNKTTPIENTIAKPVGTATPTGITSITPIGTTPIGINKTTPLFPITGSSTSRKPVLAQIIGKTPQRTSTNINSRQLLNSLPSSTNPMMSTIKPTDAMKKRSPQSSTVSLSLPSSKIAKIYENMSTLIKPIDQEPMDIDVGETPPSLDLPCHLKDHNYAIYNPVVPSFPRPLPESIPTIPSERLSYAPEVPDSPRTLYKLLKVFPKKMNTPLVRLKPNTKYGSPSGRPIRRPSTYTSKKRKTPVIKKTLLESGDEEDTPDQSDNESLSNRRRSQRNAGQRKHYIDDVELSLSDEETYETIMQPPPKKIGYFSGMIHEDESDYDESSLTSGVGYIKEKKQKKVVSVNPTEGFRYSDIYLDAPPEEANIVEKILSYRVHTPRDDKEIEKHGDNEIEECLVKYKNYSYLHIEWASMEKLLKGDKRFEGKVKRYKAKLTAQGIFANIDNEYFNPEYTEVDRVLDVAVQSEPSGEAVVHYLVKWKSLPYEDSTWELEEHVDPTAVRIFRKLAKPPSDEYIDYVKRPPPNKFKPIKEAMTYKGDNHLRPYQLEGLNWLTFNYYIRQNCILADEMGLGKTVQSIVFLLEVMNVGIRGPFMVVCPLSTIANWQREFETWSDINVVIYHGSAYSRRMIHEYDLYYRDCHGKIIPDAYKFNVLVTTYDVLLTDNSELLNILWRVAIFDEAHRLKNKNCKMLEGLKEMHMEQRVLLTGTPLQNNVEELFSLLNFLEPAKFSSLPLFLQQFGELRTTEQVDELKGVLKPMMLRRLKVDVEKSLAPKEETIIEIELTAIQKQYYRAILERNFSFLNKGSNVPSLLNTMMELRKCCNHPYLIKGAEFKIVGDFLKRFPERDISEALIQASGKLVLVDKLLPKLKENGHKVLIFSQMVRCLDILEDYLRMKRFMYERIDGQVRGTLRQEAIDRFSKPDSDRFVFLLCTRAGGLGINLTAADTVIIYDSDWNPQNDIQAQARCHRIGQNKMVKVYRLITHNSYEREMFDKASLKLGLDKAVLQTMNSQQLASSGSSQLNKIEIENLLKKGAYGIIMDNDEAADRFCEEDIDQILERRTQVIKLASEGKGSTFSKASFVSDDAGDITLDDPDFWKKWADKANLDLAKLAKKDTLVVDEPRVRRQVRRYGDELLETVVDMDDTNEEILDVIPSRGKKGWTKLECFKTEKGLLIYGWGEWDRILSQARFKKRHLSAKDVENVARTMLIYCLNHFSGDDKVKLYIHRMIDPSEITEDTTDVKTGKSSGLFTRFTEDDYLALLAKESESLFQETSYMKHLRRHSTRILLRVRQLHVIRWAIMNPYMEKIAIGTLASELGLTPPKPEEDPPLPWWDAKCDLSLLVAIVKHGYEQFRLWRSDTTLCFKDLVGEAAPRPRKSKKGKLGILKIPSAKEMDVNIDGDSDEDEFEEELYDGEESEGEGDENSSAPSTPLSIRKTRSTTVVGLASPIATPSQQHALIWPSLAEINTRARRIVNAYFKLRKKEESRLAQLQRVKEKRQRVAEESRKREQKKAELAQRWSKREEQDFVRVVSFYGLQYSGLTDNYDWKKFRQLANLGKKTDERLTLYYNDFKKMCERVVRKRSPRPGISGVKVEVVSEERAIKCLQRIELLTVVRRELLPHPNFDELIKLCEASFEVPHWWIPVQHDRDLLIGISKHGMYRTDHLIYNDPELSFLESIPKSALFTPNPSQDDVKLSNNNNDDDDDNVTMETSPQPNDNESESEEEQDKSEKDGEVGGAKGKTSALNSTPVPLGWPKEKALVIRVSRIAYGFRNKVWPKPMEGLELFNPINKLQAEPDSLSPTPPPLDYSDEYDENDMESVIGEESDSNYDEDDMEVDCDGDEEYSLPVAAAKQKKIDLTLKIGKMKNGNDLSVNNSTTSSTSSTNVLPTSFQVEKQQGFKMTFRKSGRLRSTGNDKETEKMELNVKIPLVLLQFPTAKGLKRIPRIKRSKVEGDTSTSTSTSNK